MDRELVTVSLGDASLLQEKDSKKALRNSNTREKNLFIAVVFMWPSVTWDSNEKKV